MEIVLNICLRSSTLLNPYILWFSSKSWREVEERLLDVMKAFYLGRINTCSSTFYIFLEKHPRIGFTEVTGRGVRPSEPLPWWPSHYFGVPYFGVWWPRRLPCECPHREDGWSCCGSTGGRFQQVARQCGMTNLMPAGLGCNPSSLPAAREEERALHGHALSTPIHLHDAHPSLIQIVLAFHRNCIPFWVLFWTPAVPFRARGTNPMV